MDITNLNVTEWLGEQGVWLCKNRFGEPHFYTLDRIDMKMLNLIEMGYFRQIPVPYNYDKVKEYYLKVGYEYGKQEIEHSYDKSRKTKTLF